MYKTITGLVCGYFDIFHAGHVHFLKSAQDAIQKKAAEITVSNYAELDISLCYANLIVALAGDRSLKFQKGEDRPYMPVDQREVILKACRYVDAVHTYEPMEDIYDVDQYHGHRKLIAEITPDYFIHSRQTPHTHLTEILEEFDVKPLYVDSINIHTTNLMSGWRK